MLNGGSASIHAGGGDMHSRHQASKLNHHKFSGLNILACAWDIVKGMALLIIFSAIHYDSLGMLVSDRAAD